MHDSISTSGSHPQIVTLANGQLLIAWDEGVQVNNKSVKRIAVQKRTAAGAGSIKNFIMADTAMATYPVLAPLDETTSFSAYSIKKGK